MPRGRPPNPDAVNYLRGDPGKRRRYEVTPEAVVGIPEAPAHLCPIARAAWDEIVPLLADMKVLAKTDRAAIESYCEAWARYRQAADIIARDGPLTKDVVHADGSVTPGGKYSPLNRVVTENQALIKFYLVEFGCTAAGRVRMRYKPEEKKVASKWAGKIAGA